MRLQAARTSLSSARATHIRACPQPLSRATGTAWQLQQHRPLAPRTSSHRGLRSSSAPPSAFLDSLKSLFGANSAPDADMGNSSSSSSAGWAPATEGAPRKLSRSGYDITPLTRSERTRAAESLPSMSQHVTLEHGTERPFTGKTVNGVAHDSKTRGTYVCALGGLPLFSSDTKFNSGTGWPSFYAPIDPEHIIEVTDRSIAFMPRVEVLDRRSGAHLGHVFDDGPAPTGKRYCINAAALRFIPEGETVPEDSQPVSKN